MKNMEESRISIIVPVYNVKNYLKRCLDSLINQSYKNLEIVLVDDGSFDGSEIECDKYQKLDERIKVIHKKNGGLSDARNVGLLNISGEYVLFVDSDDSLELNTCSELIKIIGNDESFLIFGFDKINSNTENLIDEVTPSFYEEIYGKLYLIKMISGKEPYSMSACRIFYRSSFIKNNNLLFEKKLLHEDIDFVFRALFYADKIKTVDKKYYHYYIRPNSITTQKNLQNNGISLKKICIKLFNFYREHNNLILKESIIIENYLCGLYLHAFIIANKENGYYYFDKTFVQKCHKKGINKIKVFLFCINSKFYLQLVKLIKKIYEKTNEN